MERRRPRRGAIWFVYTPGQPDDPHQPRPALVVSRDVRNQLADDLIVVPIFSAGSPSPTHVPMRAGMGGILHDSIIFCEEITTVHNDFVIDGPLGALVSDGILQRIIRAVRRALGEPVPEP